MEAPARSFRPSIEAIWETSVLPALAEYTTIRCLSPAFDPDWATHGALAEAAELLASWARRRPVPGVSARVVTLPGRTPVVLVEVPARGAPADAAAGGGTDPGTGAGTVLVYGHLDKQPPAGDWRPGLDPFVAVGEGDRLYGRGTADDGYALFAALSGLETLAAWGMDHPRVVVLIEGSEESGSPDLPAYLDSLAPEIGRPALVLCLDSGAASYDRLWITDSLRGNLVATLRVDVLTQGVHSGMAGGVVPSSFRILRQLLSRIEDEATGEILLPELRAEVSERARAALVATAGELGAPVLPTVPGLQLTGATDPAEALLAAAWSPALAITGIDGAPATAEAGNVLRPFTTAKLSLRLPPPVDARAAGAALVAALTRDPPSGARVTVHLETPADGWVSPDPPAWLAEAVDAASQAAFGRPAGRHGEGGTIPFLAELGRRFPGVPFVATGVLGPGSNAHGPDEFLHVPMALGVSESVAHLIGAAGLHADASGAGARR